MNFWQKCFPCWIQLFSKKAILFYFCFLCLWLSSGVLFCRKTENITSGDTVKTAVPDPWTENWLYKKVYPLIFKMEAEREQEKDFISSFEQYNGKAISQIYIVNLDVFEMLPDKPETHIYNRILDLGNDLHYKTRDWIIKDMLFFSEGDIFNPEIMNLNLVYLKELPYLREAELLISDNEDSTVDVFVLVRDKFSLELSGKIISSSKYRLKINEQNILGLGLGLKHIWHINPKEMKTLSWETYYSDANIKSTFIRVDAFWKEFSGNSNQNLYLSHPFLFPAIPYSGGLEGTRNYIHPPVDTLTTEKWTLGSWYAHSFGSSKELTNAYKYVALGLEKNWFTKRPEVDENTNNPWQDNIFALGSFAFSKTGYTSFRNISFFLMNNVLPVGYLTETLLGYEIGEYRNRLFTGLHYSRADKLPYGSYLYFSSAWETYFTREGTEQSVLAVEPLFISPLQHFGDFRSRFFFTTNLVLGGKRYPGEHKNVSSLPGYRGIWNLQGNKLLRSNLENDITTPYQIWGFKIGLFSFLDCAFATDRFSQISTKNVLLTEGAGFRIHNPALIWESIELCFALNQKKGSKGEWKITLSTKKGLELPDFSGIRPQTYKFQ